MTAPPSLLGAREATVAGRLLSNGRYAVLLTPDGCGMSAHDGFALTRWAADPLQAAGTFCYLRDLDRGVFWSATNRPAIPGAPAGTARCAAGIVSYARCHDGIETLLDVAVSLTSDAELRRLDIANVSGSPRRIEVTTFTELVLNTPAAHAAHPAFSKLFVETGYDDARHALFAHRRPRAPGDRPLWSAHVVLASDVAPPGWETDRARFLGRGRSLSAPVALTGGEPLSGTVGNVLDPVFVLRRVVTLEPGEHANLTAIYAAAGDRGALERTLDDLASISAVDAVFHAPAPADAGSGYLLGVPHAWLRGVSLDGDWELRAATGIGGSAAQVRTGEAEGGSAASTRSDHADPPARARSTAASAVDDEALRFFNGYGGFTADGREYVIRIPCGRDGALLPPAPWINVIANERAGFFVSERGAAHTWAVNSRENRITPWSNDPVSDPHGEAFYIRDDATGSFHSLCPGPAPAEGEYEVRHGFGYTRFLHQAVDLAHELDLFVPVDAPVRVARVRVMNRTDVSRELSLYAYAQLVLGGDPTQTRDDIDVTRESNGALFARNADRGEFSGRVAFAAGLGAPVHVCADRLAFLGADGDPARPAALARPVLEERSVPRPDPCAALQLRLRLEPGTTATVAFLLGEAGDGAEAEAMVRHFATIAAVDEALAAVQAYWRERLSRVQVETPVPELDLVVNGWLSYQNLSCRMWGRTAFYQSGGAYGFRDQLQDASALLYLDAAMTRSQLLLHAAHQFVEGDVLHWWHPPLSNGIRTRFSDDLLWLPYVTAFYLRSTGDDAVLDEGARFLAARPLADGEDEAFLVPEDSGTSATLFEHCCRSIDRSLTKGAHGLPLIGVGDWNDGMNRVGREGRGESVWLGFFLYDILHDFVPLCEERGEVERARRYRGYHRELGSALNEAGWDGDWYRRAFYDDGKPLGAAASDECRIDTIAQAWAVLSGAAPAQRADRALDAMERHLVAESDGIFRLLTPAFDRTLGDPGYIRGYLPGVRENGGQYTHGALWGVRALAQAGRGARATRLLAMLSPVSHGRTPEEIERYRVEPYVVAADVYGVAPHVGRGGWTWYTGSAGWMFRVALESVLGFSLRDGREIALQPCIPHDWAGFTIRYRPPAGGACTIEVVQDAAVHETRATMNGAPLVVREGVVIIPLPRAGMAQHVHVVLGSDVRARYEPRPA